MKKNILAFKVSEFWKTLINQKGNFDNNCVFNHQI